MTVNRNFKKTVRAHAAERGISYMQALSEINHASLTKRTSPLLSDHLRGALAHPSVFLGTTYGGSPVPFDIGENMIIVGSTGSGKSTTVSSILYQALHGRDGMSAPNTIFWIGEAKIGLHKFRNYPSVTRFVDSFSNVDNDYLTAANHLLIEAADEMHKRNRVIFERRASDISDIRDESHSYPDIVLVLDEIVELVSNTTTLTLLEQITSQGRKAGVSVIATTASPSALPDALVGRFGTTIITSDIPSSHRFGIQNADLANHRPYQGIMIRDRHAVEYDMFSLSGIALASWTTGPRRPYFLTDSVQDFVQPFMNGVDLITAPHLVVTGKSESARTSLVDSAVNEISDIDRVVIQSSTLNELSTVKELMETQQDILMDSENIIGHYGIPESVARALAASGGEEFEDHPYRSLVRYVIILTVNGPLSGRYAEELKYIVRRGRVNGIAFIFDAADPFYLDDDTLDHTMIVNAR